eukprot:6938277-Prymnesium_polylepis.2
MPCRVRSAEDLHRSYGLPKYSLRMVRGYRRTQAAHLHFPLASCALRLGVLDHCDAAEPWLFHMVLAYICVAATGMCDAG